MAKSDVYFPVFPHPVFPAFLNHIGIKVDRDADLLDLRNAIAAQLEITTLRVALYQVRPAAVCCVPLIAY